LCAVAAAEAYAPVSHAETIHFSYAAPAGCPSEGALVEAIVRDGGHIMRAADGLSARAFFVDIREAGDVTGRLLVRDRSGQESTRTIRGARCEDVASSLAVLVSLALEPGATEAPPAVVTRSPAEPPRNALVVHDASAGEPPDDTAPLPYGWRLGPSASGTLGFLGSRAVLGLAAYVDLVHDVPNAAAFAVRLGGEVGFGSIPPSAASPPPQNGGAVGMKRRVLRLDGCPVRGVVRQPWSSSTIEAWACARFDLGDMEAGDGLDTQHHTWAAPGPVLRVRWVDRRFFFEIEGAVTFPLRREGYVRSPSSFSTSEAPEYRVPAVVGGSGIGVGWFFL
jgi:hypothetical protein